MKKSIYTARIIVLFTGYALFSLYYFALHRIKKTRTTVKNVAAPKQQSSKILTLQHQQ